MHRHSDSELIAAGLTIHGRPSARHSGRDSDIPQPYTAVETRRVEAPTRAPERPSDTPLWQVAPKERKAFRSAKAAAAASQFTSSWETTYGHVAVADKIKFYTGKCTECTKEFKVSRPASRRGKWPSLCSEKCRKDRKRRQDAAALKKHRQRR